MMDKKVNMLPEETLACLRLYSMQFIKLSPTEQLKLDELVNRRYNPGTRNDEGKAQTCCQRLGLSDVGVNGKRNVRRKASLGRKQQPLKSSLSVPFPNDDYVAPSVPPVRGLARFIKECTSPFEKRLTASDLKDDQSRLSFSKHDAEKLLLPLVKGMDLKLGVSTTVYDMEGNSFPMVFKNWCEKYYVLTSGWKEFYKSHDLKPVKDVLTVWMFRHRETKNICFAVSSRRLDGNHIITKSLRKG